MTRSLTEEPARQAPLTAPSTSGETAQRDGLDWEAFRDLYYPESRRHSLEAIVAYGAYRRPGPEGPPEAKPGTGAARRSSHPAPLDTWEGEGGAAEQAG